MKSQGICITDKIGHVISVELPDILEEVHNGDEFYWSILFLDVMGDLGEEDLFRNLKIKYLNQKMVF